MELSSISAERLGFSLRYRDGALVIAVRGDLDVTNRDLLDDYLTRATGGYGQIILQLAAVECMDCASLAVIVAHWRAVTARGGTLSLAGLRCLPARVLQLTGLTAVLPLNDSAGQRLKLGKRNAGKLVTVIIEDTCFRVPHGEEELAVRARSNADPLTRIRIIHKRDSQQQPSRMS